MNKYFSRHQDVRLLASATYRHHTPLGTGPWVVGRVAMIDGDRWQDVCLCRWLARSPRAAFAPLRFTVPSSPSTSRPPLLSLCSFFRGHKRPSREPPSMSPFSQQGWQCQYKDAALLIVPYIVYPLFRQWVTLRVLSRRWFCHQTVKGFWSSWSLYRTWPTWDTSIVIHSIPCP